MWLEAFIPTLVKFPPEVLFPSRNVTLMGRTFRGPNRPLKYLEQAITGNYTVVEGPNWLCFAWMRDRGAAHVMQQVRKYATSFRAASAGEAGGTE